MDSEHGIGLTHVDCVDLRDYPAMATARVELSVLSLGDYDAYGQEISQDAGSVCLGQGGSECLEIFWGPEEQFNTILSLEGGDEFAEARRGGARWPLPVAIEFNLPNNHDSAALEFGGHRIPLDLRGMTGDPAFDYTAHYAEATPGSTLYKSEGKTSSSTA